MDIKQLNDRLSVSPQISAADMPALRAAGYRTVICNRPDGEDAVQPAFAEIAAAARACGIEAHYLPIEPGKPIQREAGQLGILLDAVPGPVLAYCRTGTRSTMLWMQLCGGSSTPGAAQVADAAGHASAPAIVSAASHEIVIVGAGAAGIATASSLLARVPDLDIAVIDPAETHYYQPGWTLVGAGVFRPETTTRAIADILPSKVEWIRTSVTAFEPEHNRVVLEGGRAIGYRQLIVCPGLTLDWEAIEGLPQTLGRNGVTSNYRYDLAPYTWQLVRELKSGRALFTQPPMPIKCAGAPQKAMYLSSDHWRRAGRLEHIDVSFFNAGAVLFGVPDYVPALMKYVESYGIALNFGFNLSAIDGAAKRATFTRALADGGKERVETDFDMIHVVPPQRAPDFVRASPLADAAGWVDVDQTSLRHKRFDNVFGLGDVTNTPNAKTAAAARKQAPVVAHNVLAALGRVTGAAGYDGYGSCPLTVERGKIVLAEFLYGGKVAPTFPAWLIDGQHPSRLAWLLKERVLPPLYWRGMLKGREWLAQPRLIDAPDTQG